MSEKDAAYVNLAWALVGSAASDYHNFHNPDIRRRLVMACGPNHRDAEHQRLKTEAELADSWISGCPARYPFWLAAEWLGWDEKTLADWIRSKRTGENLLLQLATTEKNKHLPSEDRLREYLRAA